VLLLNRITNYITTYYLFGIILAYFFAGLLTQANDIGQTCRETGMKSYGAKRADRA
jgi:preprotein translocase subunit SecY